MVVVCSGSSRVPDGTAALTRQQALSWHGAAGQYPKATVPKSNSAITPPSEPAAPARMAPKAAGRGI